MFRISDFRTDLCSLKLYEDGLSGFWMLNRAPATSAVDMLGVTRVSTRLVPVTVWSR